MTTTLPDLPDQPHLQALFDALTPAQQRYLAYLAHSSGPVKAAKRAGISHQMPSVWRCQRPAFRLAEAAVKAAIAEHGSNLAANLARSHAPVVMLKVIDRAESNPTSDRQLVTSQKAAEVVLRAAGVLQDAPPGVPGQIERIDILAMRLWTRQGVSQLSATVPNRIVEAPPVLPAASDPPPKGGNHPP